MDGVSLDGWVFELSRLDETHYVAVAMDVRALCAGVHEVIAHSANILEKLCRSKRWTWPTCLRLPVGECYDNAPKLTLRSACAGA